MIRRNALSLLMFHVYLIGFAKNLISKKKPSKIVENVGVMRFFRFGFI